MPRRDPIPSRLTPSRASIRIDISARLDRKPPGKRRPRKGGEAEREPVEPPRPKPLAGGAAAALEFDD